MDCSSSLILGKDLLTFQPLGQGTLEVSVQVTNPATQFSFMLGPCLSSWCLRALLKTVKVFDNDFRASDLKSLSKAYPQSLARALLPHFHKHFSEVNNDFQSESLPRRKHCTLPSPSCRAGSMSSIIYSTFRRTSVKLLRANTYMSTGRKSSAPYGFPEQRETQSGPNKNTEWSPQKHIPTQQWQLLTQHVLCRL